MNLFLVNLIKTHPPRFWYRIVLLLFRVRRAWEGYSIRLFIYVLLVGLLPLLVARDASGSTEFSLSVGLWAHHMETSSDTNERIDLLAISYNNYIMSRFKNSFSDETYFAGKRFHTKRRCYDRSADWYAQGNLYLGLMHGYDDNLPGIGGISPGLLPTFGLGYRRTSFELGYVPTMQGGVFVGLFRFLLHTE